MKIQITKIGSTATVCVYICVCMYIYTHIYVCICTYSLAMEQIKKIVFKITPPSVLLSAPDPPGFFKEKKFHAMWNIPEERKTWKVISFIL